MRVSVVTTVYNNIKYLESTIKSVSMQTLGEVEHIIVDGGSTDGTAEFLKNNSKYNLRFVSEKDNGIYDGINKGIELSRGNIIGILNSDDVYANDKVLSNVCKIFKSKNVSCLYGDLTYRDKDLKKNIRYWKSGEYVDGIMEKGWMPPHPTFFVKRSIYNKYGNYNTNYKISSDYDLMLRFLHVNKISTYYLPEVMVNMRCGGRSNRVKNYFMKWNEDLRAMKENNIRRPKITLLKKNVSKIKQFL